jgi:hypothetical protein
MNNLDMFTFKLSNGAHKSPQDGTCFMEAVAWMAREPHSDVPECACPVLGKVGIRLNDLMSDDERKSLNPLIIKMMNTRGKEHEEPRAAYIIRESAVRILAPLFDARGWADGARMLRALPVGVPRHQLIQPLRAIRDYAVNAYQKRVAADAAADAVAYAAAAAVAVAYAYANANVKKFRSLWIHESVAILNEAIELGPHNSAEFYDDNLSERIVAFQREILQPQTRVAVTSPTG